MEIMHHNIVGALPVTAWYNTTAGHVHHHRSVLMHVAFYWGKNAEFLFSGWPGSSTGMYALALIFVFGLAVLVEWLSHCKHIKPGANRVASGLFQTGIHAVRAGFVYMVMLAVMSYNAIMVFVQSSSFDLIKLIFDVKFRRLCHINVNVHFGSLLRVTSEPRIAQSKTNPN
ncbi:hypothetical protein RHGRI_011789 [Rhododendron griersonianum]|uniref:Copper transport protein n=1 Tax=Rhododendron griersonianum TaxID=479676 RepID=A0AAV6KN56_9ERIC|nr:hypothetical protein RHGRI_011789 [Rhododendron griersonianum]